MIRLLEDQALRNKIILQAEKKVRRRFDNRRLVKELAGVYNQYVFHRSGQLK